MTLLVVLPQPESERQMKSSNFSSLGALARTESSAYRPRRPSTLLTANARRHTA